MNLSPDFNFFETIRAADERIPIEAVEFGAKVMFEVMTRYGQRT